MTKQKYFDYKLKLKIKKLASEKILSLIKTIQFDQWSKFTQEYKRKLNLKNLFFFSYAQRIKKSKMSHFIIGSNTNQPRKSKLKKFSVLFNSMVLLLNFVKDILTELWGFYIFKSRK